MSRLIVCCFALLVLVPAAAIGCLWDFDTLEMERQRFPSTLELITGEFLRHSKEFYEWRIDDRKRRLEAGGKDVALYDDLAVAYDKTGQQELAIETALKTEELFPGRYETAANLGTFYIHSQKFEQGLVHIGQALEINPDAHFGREEYQKLLVEYVIEKRQNGQLSLPMEPEGGRHLCCGFASFVLLKKGIEPEKGERAYGEVAQEELDRALKGVQGMMRFGNHRSPVLLEALGDLLMHNSAQYNGLQLAARAYLAASEAPEQPAIVKAAYRALAEEALVMQLANPPSHEQMTLAALEDAFRQESADATAWYDALAADERSWIQDGLNPEAEFTKKYDAELAPTNSPVVQRGLILDLFIVALAAVLAAAVGLTILRRSSVRWRHKQREASGHNAGS